MAHQPKIRRVAPGRSSPQRVDGHHSDIVRGIAFQGTSDYNSGMNKFFAASFLSVSLALIALTAPAAESKPEVAAQEPTARWLALVDAGKYAESWQDMAPDFKKQVSQGKWKSIIAEIRKPLGKVVARKLVSADFTKDLPGAPEGEYVVSKFTTDFEKKSGAVETVTMVLGTDLIWRASVYAVK